MWYLMFIRRTSSQIQESAWRAGPINREDAERGASIMNDGVAAAGRYFACPACLVNLMRG